MKTLGGRLPDNAKEMQDKVPGIGRYSAGAICSIAYGERVPVVSEALLFLEMYVTSTIIARWQRAPSAEPPPCCPCTT